MKNRWLILLVVCCFFGSGCMALIPQTPSAVVPRSLKKNKEKIPLDVAIYFPEEFLKNEQWYEGRDFFNAQFNVGKSSRRLFKKGLSKLFRTVSETNRKPRGQENYDLIFTPKILQGKKTEFKDVSSIYYKLDAVTISNNKFTWDGKGSGQGTNFLADVKYDRQGRSAWRLCLFPILTIDFFLGYSFIADYSGAISKAQTAAFENLAQNIRNDHAFLAFAKEINERKSRPSDLILTAGFHDNTSVLPNNLLDAGEKGEVAFTITNNGDGPGFDLRLKIKSQNSHTTIAKKYEVGTIPPHLG